MLDRAYNWILVHNILGVNYEINDADFRFLFD
jgi:hypothetical protein